MEATDSRTLKRLSKLHERVQELKRHMWEEHYEVASLNESVGGAAYATAVATYLDIAEDALRKAASEFRLALNEGDLSDEE